MAHHAQFTISTGIKVHSAIRTSLGNADQTRRPMDRSASTRPRERTSPCTPPRT
jgi:hypothetical protein